MPLPQITSLYHPDYNVFNTNWRKFRLTYTGGNDFITSYLEKFSVHESDDELAIRKNVAYCPAFSKAAINEIRNSIYQRFSDIKRIGGSKSYQLACAGYDGGVDLSGNTMNSFMGCKVLQELMIIGKVGIYVDMPPLRGPAKIDNLGLRPYLYYYCAEDILNWTFDRYQNFTSVLLREHTYDYDESGFPTDTSERFRHIYKNDEGVFIQLYKEDGSEIEAPVKLNITKIPFILSNLSQSLMTDIADYQIALLNLTSSDLSFVIKANFPHYVEQYNPVADMQNMYKQSQATGDGTQATTEKSSETTAQIGITTGRRYPINTDAPQFIHPSTEPLLASMQKQDKLKEEIRLLLNLSIANLQPKRSSADSKAQDERPLENGLSYIGLELAHCERLIAEIWAEYEGEDETATVHYPVNYSLVTEDEARKEAEDLDKLSHKLPSITYQKELGKRIATILLGCKVSQDTLTKIHNEIDSAITMNSDPEVINMDLESGLVGNELASKMRGYPEGEVAKAKVDHAEKLEMISRYQSQGGVNGAARGVPQMGGNAKQEKKDSQNVPDSPVPVDNTRGEGK